MLQEAKNTSGWEHLTSVVKTEVLSEAIRRVEVLAYQEEGALSRRNRTRGGNCPIRCSELVSVLSAFDVPAKIIKASDINATRGIPLDDSFAHRFVAVGKQYSVFGTEPEFIIDITFCQFVSDDIVEQTVRHRSALPSTVPVALLLEMHGYFPYTATNFQQYMNLLTSDRASNTQLPVGLVV